jgi:hypothetical protein
MNNIINPYISGPPVIGVDFYGRQQDLQKVLDTEHRGILFIATRRVGKTSLCYEIKHICKTEKDYNSYLCVDWDLQGVRNIPQAKMRLLSGPNQESLERVDWNHLRTIPTCHEVIEAVCDPYSKPPNKKTILLLVDEPEAFLHFAQRKETDFLVDLKYTIETIPNLRVVIVSPPKIQNLSRYKEIPYLLEKFNRYFLREFNDTEAEQLIQLSKGKKPVPLTFLETDKQVINDIKEVSNRVPFYIQQICLSIFDAYPDQRPSQVMESIIEQQTFAPFFESDFNVLHPIQKIMLLNLVNSHEPQDRRSLIDVTKDVATKIEGELPAPKHISELLQLGILKKFAEDKYHLSNRLFERWILDDFENLWNQTMEEIAVEKTFDKKIFKGENLKKKDLEEIKAELEAFQRVLKELHKDYSDGTVKEEFYYKRRLSMVRDHELLIKKFQDHLSSHGAHALAQVLEKVKQDNIDDSVIRDSLTRAEQEGRSKGWGNIVSRVIKDDSISRVGASMVAAFEVAEFLVDND